MPNMKALAQILFEISCTQDFQILFLKGHNSEKGHNSDMKKNTGQLFIMRNTYMKFQIPSMHHSEVNRRTHRHTDRHTDRQAESNMPFQLFQSWGHKNRRHKFFTFAAVRDFGQINRIAVGIEMFCFRCPSLIYIALTARLKR